MGSEGLEESDGLGGLRTLESSHFRATNEGISSDVGEPS